MSGHLSFLPGQILFSGVKRQAILDLADLPSSLSPKDELRQINGNIHPLGVILLLPRNSWYASMSLRHPGRALFVALTLRIAT
jgi:hypothetical protein